MGVHYEVAVVTGFDSPLPSKNIRTMLDIKKFYLILRKHGIKAQSKLRTQLRFKKDGDRLYDAYLHGVAYGMAQAYQNVAGWVKQCQKEDKV